MPHAILLALLAVVCCAAEVERPQLEIAVVQMNRLTNDIDYDRIRLLNLDKDTIEAIKKINADQAKLKKDIIEVTDEVKLMDIQKQVDFNNKKLMILRDRNGGGNRDVNIQKLAGDFVVKRYAGRFAMILQDTNGIDGRVLYKNVKITDISEEAADAFKKDLAERIGER